MAIISERFDNLGADGEPVRLGLMGGTFDPIHVGHLRVAEEMRKALNLDAVLFIPTGNPVFKRDQQVTDARLRLEMCRLAVLSNPHFDVSAIEVERTGDTFTVDTLQSSAGPLSRKRGVLLHRRVRFGGNRGEMARCGRAGTAYQPSRGCRAAGKQGCRRAARYCPCGSPVRLAYRARFGARDILDCAAKRPARRRSLSVLPPRRGAGIYKGKRTV